MRGGFLHNQVIAAGLRAALEGLGARVKAEYPAGPGRRAGAVDLYAELNGGRLVCEVELGPRRVLQDVRKAEAIHADILVIVAPTPRAARIIRHRLRTTTGSDVSIRVLPYGLAIKYLSQVQAVEYGRDRKTRSPRPGLLGRIRR